MREGKIRGLGVASATRNALAPELPTMIEGGIPDLLALTFTGVVAPAGTPASIVNKLNAAINQSLKPAEIVTALGKLGAEVRTGSAQEFAAFIAKEPAVVRRGDAHRHQGGVRRAYLAAPAQSTCVSRASEAKPGTQGQHGSLSPWIPARTRAHQRGHP